MRFDGADDFVSAALDLSETSCTVSLWLKTSVTDCGLYSVVDGDLGTNGYDRSLYTSHGDVAGRIYSEETIASSGTDYADGDWHHLVYTYGSAASGQRIYVDGQLVASGSKAYSDFTWQTGVNIGFANEGASRFFDGWIDDVAIWNQTLSEAQIQALARGASPLKLSGYSLLIGTDVGQEMRGVNSSIYVRVPFQVPESHDYDSLELRMRYDDGFVAYLNGQEIARRYAPATLQYNSTATDQRLSSNAVIQERIDISAHEEPPPDRCQRPGHPRAQLQRERLRPAHPSRNRRHPQPRRSTATLPRPPLEAPT